MLDESKEFKLTVQKAKRISDGIVKKSPTYLVEKFKTLKGIKDA